MLELLKDFFLEHQPTVEDAHRKAEQAGWQVEETNAGYTVHGKNAEGQPASWPFTSHQIVQMNDLLDHRLSVELGEQYRLATYGNEEPTDTHEAIRRKYEIRAYRFRTYYKEEYKPSWKRLLGL